MDMNIDDLIRQVLLEMQAETALSKEEKEKLMAEILDILVQKGVLTK